MTNWTTNNILDMLNEVGAYALEPTEMPESIDRTYGYYVGWRACIMYLQEAVHDRSITAKSDLQALLDEATQIAAGMEHALAFTSDATSVDDLPSEAMGDERLRLLLQYARGWQAAAGKTEDRFRNLEDRLFE